MSEFKKRNWFPLALAPPRVPGNPHGATVTRWALKGVLVGPNGERIKLATRKVGGRRYTCQEWIDEFIERVSGERGTGEALSAQRAAAVTADEQELDAEGIA
jgi:hypothetical protein